MRYLDSNKFSACYGRLDEDSKSFDMAFWQKQGSKVIFEAAYDMIKDYLILRGQYVNDPQLQRTIESFEKAPM